MGRPNTAILAVFFLAMIALFGGVTLFKGGVFIEKHEGDAYQLIEMVLRVADGQRPHLDFMTPIGFLALAPISAFVALGFGIGKSFVLAQIAVAFVLSVLALRVAVSRLDGVWSFLFGLIVVVLCTALVHGEADRAVSISMHYNRWAWALSYIVIALAMLEPLRDRAPVLDGVILGAGMAALALTKITYFVAFFPPVVLALLMRRQWRMILAAIIAGVAVGAAVTALVGMEFWYAYLDDLIAVTQSEARQRPGADLSSTITAPAYLGASFLLLGAVVALRQSRQEVPGLLLLLLAPGFVYVTYQNFGNDPQWLYFVAMLMFALRPRTELRNGLGWDMRAVMLVIGVAVLSHGAPSALNLVYSPFRHFFLAEDDFGSLLPRAGLSDDLHAREIRLYRTDGNVPLDRTGTGLDAWKEEADRPPAAELKGEELADCELMVGMTAWFTAASRDLDAAGFAGARLFAADVFNSYPLFGDFPFLQGGAPWYYGGLSGYDNADYVIVPLCPIAPDVRANVLETLTERGETLEEVRRTPLYILLRKMAS